MVAYLFGRNRNIMLKKSRHVSKLISFNRKTENAFSTLEFSY